MLGKNKELAISRREGKVRNYKLKVNHMEHKFKIGDKVKSSSYAKGLIGEIIKVRAENYTVDFGGEYNSGHDGDMGREYEGRCWFITEKTLELVSSGQNNKPYSNLIIHCPTEEEYKRVCIKLGEEGYGTWTEGIALRWYEENGKMVIWKSPWKWYKEEYEKGDYKDHTFLTAKEFLGEEEEVKRTKDSQIIKCKNIREYKKALDYLFSKGFIWWCNRNGGSFETDIKGLDWNIGDEYYLHLSIISKDISRSCRQSHLTKLEDTISLNDFILLFEDNEPLTTKKKSMLQRLSDTLKRVLNKDMQAQFKAGYINGGLELTEKGIKVLLNLIAQEKEKELGTSALEYIKEKKEGEDE